MINFKSMLITTSDIQMIQSAAIDPNTKILYMGDPAGAQDIISTFRMIVAGPWIPDFVVMEADLNGIYEEFVARYTDYLNREESLMMMATLVTALYQGKNIILYFPPETSEFKYPTFLLQYLQVNLGITPTSPNSAFQFNPNYSDKLAFLMYQFNTISPVEFILLTDSMDINSLSKVVADLGIPVSGDMVANPKPVLDWIESYKQTMLEYKMEMQKPIMIEVKC